MNTKTSEVRLILESILKESLQQGIVPDLMDIVNTEQHANIGNVKTINTLDGEVARSEDLNSGFTAIEQNLRILEESASLETEDTLSHRSTFYSRLGRLERWYRSLAYRVESLILLTRTGTRSLYLISETFSNLTNIDLDNTSATIDTVSGVAEIGYTTQEYNEEAESGSANIYITNVTLTDDKVTKDINHENNNIYYKHISESIDNVELEVKLKIIRMNDIYKGGRIELKLGFTDNTIITSIIGSSDNKNSEPLSYSQKSNLIYIPVSTLYKDLYITMVLKKTNHEGEKIDDNGKVTHQFIFDINTIRLPNRSYKTSGIIQTQNYELPDVLSERGIAQYALTLEGYAPGDTRILSSISFDNGAFNSIPANTIIPLGLVSSRQTKHPHFTVTREVPTPISKLDGVTDSPAFDASVLLEGWGQAEVESQSYTASAADLPYWATHPGYKAYQGLSSPGIFLGPGLTHKVFLRIDSPKVQEVTLSNVGVRNQEYPEFNQADYMTLFFNGQRLNGKTLPDDTREYKLTLIKGSNTLNLLVGINGNFGGYLNLGTQLSGIDIETYVKERRVTSMAAILNLDASERAYAIDNGSIYLNYIPPSNAQFLHRYNLPTSNLPSEVKLKFDMEGADEQSPFVTGFKLEFTPGSTL